jgi:hypothetical protein
MTVHDRRLKALRAEERARVQTEKVRVSAWSYPSRQFSLDAPYLS